MDCTLIGVIITGISVGGGLIFTGFKINNNKKPNGYMTEKNCNLVQENNTKEHEKLFDKLDTISGDTATLLERTKNM